MNFKLSSIAQGRSILLCAALIAASLSGVTIAADSGAALVQAGHTAAISTIWE